jgi:hypothetical protein
MERERSYPWLMAKSPKVIDQDVRDRVSKNLNKLKDKHSHSVGTISQGSGVGHGTVQRALHAGTGLSIDQIAKLAKFYGLSDWHLFLPDLDPDSKPPKTISAEDFEAIEHLRRRPRR